ncbi:hypothetical protein KI387_044128, partial [Taxus chinensis]
VTQEERMAYPRRRFKALAEERRLTREKNIQVTVECPHRALGITKKYEGEVKEKPTPKPVPLNTSALNFPIRFSERQQDNNSEGNRIAAQYHVEDHEPKVKDPIEAMRDDPRIPLPAHANPNFSPYKIFFNIDKMDGATRRRKLEEWTNQLRNIMDHKGWYPTATIAFATHNFQGIVHDWWTQFPSTRPNGYNGGIFKDDCYTLKTMA